MNLSSVAILESFLASLAVQTDARATLSINLSEFIAPNLIEFDQNQSSLTWDDPAARIPLAQDRLIAELIKKQGLPLDKPWDLIFATLPWNVKPPGDLRERGPLELIPILEATSLLSPNGYAVFLMPTGAAEEFVPQEPPFRGRYRTAIAHFKTLYPICLRALISLPKKFSAPFSGINCALMILQKGPHPRNEDIFFADMLEGTDKHIEHISRNFVQGVEDIEAGFGCYISSNVWESLNFYRARTQLLNLKSDYDEYEYFNFGDLILDLNRTNGSDDFEPKQNALYLPIISDRPAVSSHLEMVMKPKNYYQVILDGERALPEYLCAFLNSPIGTLLRQPPDGSTTLATLSRRKVTQLPIRLPPLEIQRKVKQSYAWINAMRAKLQGLEEQFALHPLTSDTAFEEFQNQAQGLAQTSATVQIKSTIQRGETKTSEFKQTFSWDVETREKSDRLIVSSLKTLTAFMNTEGGTLLIGVDDAGQITGLEEEISKFDGNSEDKFLLRFQDSLKRRIGSEFFPLIDYTLTEVDRHLVLVIECRPSKSPVFLFPAKRNQNPNGEIYIRTNPATEKIEGRQIILWMQNRSS
jgi:hypothetical protein